MQIKKIYYYLVLFATLLMSIGGSVSTFMALADVVSPAPYYQSFEQYKEMKLNYPKEQTNQAQLTEQELKAMYDSVVEQEKMQTRHRALNHLIKSLAWIIIPLPVFLYFQRKVRQMDQ